MLTRSESWSSLTGLPLDTTLSRSSHLPLSQLLFLKMPSGRILWGRLTEILHAFLISAIFAACPTQLNPLGFTIVTVLSELYNNEASRYVIFKLIILFSWHTHIFHGTLFSKTPNVCSSLEVKEETSFIAPKLHWSPELCNSIIQNSDCILTKVWFQRKPFLTMKVFNIF